MVLEPNVDAQSAITVPFQTIRVEDVRYDTTHIGIYSVLNNVFMPALNNYKITLKDGLHKSLGNYLNALFKPVAGARDMEVVCFIKTLSITARDTFVENKSLHRKFGQLDFEAEVFLRSGVNYYAATKIDTILYSAIETGQKQISDDMQHYLLMPALQVLCNEISRTEWTNITSRKAFSESIVMDHYYKDRFKIPVLTQPCKKGVYRSFEEFKNNNPYISNFEVKNEKFNTVLIADSTGNYIPTIKLFAYCDGEKYWILMGNYRFPMIPVCNGFEFFLSINKQIKMLFALDMEKGKIY